jgi:tetratricopeptide (TPR) repeat protein
LLSLFAQAPQSSEPPKVSTAGFLPSIRDQIEAADANARSHARDPAALGLLGMTLHAYQQYEGALAAYTRAMQLEPGNFDWIYLRGAVQLSMGAFGEAATSFRSALALRPQDLPAQLHQAQSLLGVPDWAQAASVYRSVVTAHPDCAQAWYGLGRVRAAMGNPAAAADSLRQACDLFPRYGVAHFALAAELRKLGNKDEAEQHLRSYSNDVTSEPPLPDPVLARVQALNRSAQIHLHRALELERSGQIAEAIEEERQALAIDPSDAQAHINLISLYGRINDPGSARKHFEAAIQLNPGRSDAWYNYGVLLLRQQQFAEAEQALRKALASNPDYAEAHYNLGVIQEQGGHLEEAACEFRQAVENKPNYPAARFRLGRILANQKKYEEAILQLRQSIQGDDEQTAAYLYALGATYARAGDRTQALTYLHKAHDAAAVKGQSQLLASIDRDLKTLGDER